MKVAKLFDYECVCKHRKRIDPGHHSSIYFHNEIIAEFRERAGDSFETPPKLAIVTGVPELWTKNFPEADVLPDTDVLNFPDNQYDLILHSLCLHWSNDPVGQLIQCKQSCNPGGMIMAVLFGGQNLVELRTALISGETTIKNGATPRVSPMGDILDLGNLMVRANFTNPISDRIEFKLEYESLQDLMKHLRLMGETNALVNRTKNFTGRKIFQKAEKSYIEHFSLPSGKIYATFELIFLTGWVPKNV